MYVYVYIICITLIITGKLQQNQYTRVLCFAYWQTNIPGWVRF